MTLLQFILVNTNLLLLYGMYTLLAHRKGQLNFNRIYLLLIPTLSILLPLLPYESVSIHSNWVIEMSEISIAGQLSESISTYSIPLLQFLYVVGFTISGLLFVLKLRKVMKHPDSRGVSSYRGAEVYILEHEQSSYSFFNRIYINESQLEAAEVILFHESAHSKGKHSLDLILVGLYKIIFWFNPITYFLEKSVKQNHEFIADEYVLTQDITLTEYGKAMLLASFNCAVPSLGNGFNKKSLLRKRIEHLKHKNQYNMKHLLIIPVLTGLFFASASLTGEHQESNRESNVKLLPNDEGTKPQFKGGMDALMTYLSKEIHYPKELESSGVEGKVIVSFRVETDGVVSDVKTSKSSGQPLMDAEAERAIVGMPKWIPGKKNGKVVKIEMQLPIVFKLPAK